MVVQFVTRYFQKGNAKAKQLIWEWPSFSLALIGFKAQNKKD